MNPFKYSPSILSALICGSAVLFSGAAMAAPTGPELYFYPSGQWATAQNGPNCSAQVAYNNGFVLNFQGSQSWVETLNVNFRQNIFTQGQSYAVVVSAPGVNSETLKATALDAESLAINFLGRKELYKAVKTGSVLDLKIEGNEFRFYLTGFAQAAQSFEGCMAGGASAMQNAQSVSSETYTTNEAIAMEESTKSEAATPIVQEIPYTETQKIGGEVIDPAQPIEAQAEKIGEEKLAESGMTPVSAASAAAPPAPSDASLAAPEKPVRMSDKIAQQIQDNPEIADVKNKPIPARAAPEAAAADNAETASLAPLETDTPETASAGLAMPPDMNRAALIPQTSDAKNMDYSALARAQLAGETAQAELAAPLSTTVIANDPASDTMETADDITALTPVSDDVQMAHAPAPTESTPIETAPEKETVLFDGPRVDVSEINTQPPAMPAVAVSEGEALTKDAEASIDSEALQSPAETPEVSAVEPAALTPVESEMAAEVEADTAPLAPETVTENYKTPEAIETKEVYSSTADFRKSGLPAQDSASMARMAELESMVGKLKAENVALNGELDRAINASEEERLSISSENWNLEQATMRYNEAERQLKKLGMELQKERAQCQAEKNDLEATLFDPQITSQEQMARLGSLEDQLRDAKAQLEAQRIQYESRIKELGGSI